MQKQNYRKEQKQFYQPGTKPELIILPSFKFFTIQGQGNPNDEFFGDYIQVLYALSYGIKMSPKQGQAPMGYYDYTVFPLEGVWDILDEAKADFTGTIDKNTLVFNLMIRQPAFVTNEYAQEIINKTKEKKNLPLLDIVKFETITERLCVQMLHIGSFDDEPASFRKMEEFASENGLKRKTLVHREICLSDPRKTATEKLRTVLRFQIEKI
jgi:hypothetical protein